MCVQEFSSTGLCCQEGLPPAAANAVLYMPLAATPPETWPTPGLAGDIEEVGLIYVTDDVFGTVMNCSRGAPPSL